MRRKLSRTVLSLAAAVGAVMAVRWTVRTAVTRAYRAERSVESSEVQVLPAPKEWVLAEILPEELRVNISGLSIRRRAERLHMPYALAVEVADEKAKSAGWERLDNENAITLKNLSGMERVFRTPEGSIVLREVRAVKGEDSVMEDFTMPVEMIQDSGEHVTPDVLARRSAVRIKALLPPVLRDVVTGSPMFTELIERGGGSALIVRCLSEMSPSATGRAVEAAARKAGWIETGFGDAASTPAPPASGERDARTPSASWTKRNLAFHFEIVPRPDYGGCDVNYRFTDDESFMTTKGKTDESR